MGYPETPDGPVLVPSVVGLTRAAGIALLDRAAEVGLLTSYADGRYAVHPAVPWHLQDVFERHYGPPGSRQAMAAVRAWTLATGAFGNYCHDRYEQGDAEFIDLLAPEEANLLRARQLAISNGWYRFTLDAMQGLRTLYGQTGRAIEWRRLVDEVVLVLADPATGGPLPGREQEWVVVTEYRVRIAGQARDWPAARQLQNAIIDWYREQATDALAIPTGMLDNVQRNQIDNLAASLNYLGDIMQEQGQVGCVQPYLEVIGLCQRTGDRRGEARAALHLGNAYMLVPVLYDLDQAERWYQRASELFGEHDTVGRATIVVQRGGVAYQRFLDAQDETTARTARFAVAALI